MEYLHASEQLYGLQVTIIVGEYDRQDFDKILKELDPNSEPETFGDGNEDGAKGRCWDCGHKQLLWVGSHPSDDFDQCTATTAHELVHAAFGSAESIGFTDHLKTQEFHAYYVAWAIRRYLEWTYTLNNKSDKEDLKLL